MSLSVSSTLHEFLEGCLSSGELSDQTIANLRSRFLEYGHTPSDAMWVGITALIDALESMANDTLASLPYLSPLDPGVGKTEAVVAFIQTLMSSRSHRNIGVLICVSRLEEIAKLIKNMRLVRRVDLKHLAEVGDGTQTTRRAQPASARSIAPCNAAGRLWRILSRSGETAAHCA
jgi:hypothetical protein